MKRRQYGRSSEPWGWKHVAQQLQGVFVYWRDTRGIAVASQESEESIVSCTDLWETGGGSERLAQAIHTPHLRSCRAHATPSRASSRGEKSKLFAREGLDNPFIQRGRGVRLMSLACDLFLAGQLSRPSLAHSNGYHHPQCRDSSHCLTRQTNRIAR